MGVTGAIGPSVAIQIGACRLPDIGGGSEMVGIAGTGFIERIAKRAQRGMASVIIHVEKEEDIRVGGVDDLQRGKDLRVVAAHDITEQKARPGAGQPGVKHGDTERFGADASACET
jgi:hypothetical protein